MIVGSLIQVIVSAIFRQEGEPDTALNPGNLRGAPWLTDPVISKGFWVPKSRAEGIAGAAHLVALRIAEGNSLTQLISIWAPPSDGNDTTAYIKDVMAWTGIVDPDVPLYTLISIPGG